MPLLRLARLLSSRGSFRVTCFLLSKFEKAVKDYGFEYCCLGCNDMEYDDRVFSELSKKSIFYNAFSNYYDLSDYYWTPLRNAVSHELAGLIENLRIFEPQFILCDSHIFLDHYQRLAWTCGATLIVNRSEGSLRSFHRPFVQIYGLSERKHWEQWIIETAGRIAQKMFRIWRALIHAKRRRQTIARQLAAERRVEMAFKDCIVTETEIIYVNAGLAMLEHNFSKIGGAQSTRREWFFPPTVETEEADLPGHLKDWLDQQATGQVVYVCLGTMIALSEKFLDELVQGLINSQVSVIWSLPKPQADLMAKYKLADNFRIEEFVPQTAILASNKVGCFITHGGAGSLQESLIAGKPVLCIPFMWDQPYNSSVLTRLGAGRMLSKRNLTRHRISGEIRELLSNPVYSETARHLGGKIRGLQCSIQQSGSIIEIFHAKQNHSIS